MDDKTEVSVGKDRSETFVLLSSLSWFTADLRHSGFD